VSTLSHCFGGEELPSQTEPYYIDRHKLVNFKMKKL